MQSGKQHPDSSLAADTFSNGNLAKSYAAPLDHSTFRSVGLMHLFWG
jgi:hypothetical protein